MIDLITILSNQLRFYEFHHLCTTNLASTLQCFTIILGSNQFGVHHLPFLLAFANRLQIFSCIQYSLVSDHVSLARILHVRDAQPAPLAATHAAGIFGDTGGAAPVLATCGDSNVQARAHEQESCVASGALASSGKITWTEAQVLQDVQ